MSDRSSVEGLPAIARAAKTVVSGAVAAIGVLTAIAGIWSSSLVAALNASGVIGVATLTVGGVTWAQGDAGDPIRRVRVTGIAVALTALVASFLLFVVGRPLEGAELDVNILTVIGVANLVAVATLAVLAWRTIDASATQTKVCPMCAEKVLAAARICRYCGSPLDDTAPRTT